MSKEDINNLKEMLVDFNEYSTDYTKTRCKELEKTVENTLNEIDRLNNIITELEEYIKPYLYMLNGIQDRDIYEQCQLDDFTDIMEKLQELKENNK